MSADDGRRVFVLLVCALFLRIASARDWPDVLTTPFADPLRVNPALLDTGKTLPGDELPPVCRDDAHDMALPLFLSDAVDLALCRNPQVQSAWAGIKVQAAQVGEARAAYLPTLNLGLSRLSQQTEYPESTFLVNTDRTSQARYATLTWRLLDFGGRDANRRASNALLEAALASHDAALQKTMASVVGLYFDAQTALAQLEAKRRGEELARQTLLTAEKREARGAGAQSDTLQARTSLAKAALEHARAMGAYEKAMVSLVAVMGMPAQPVQALHLAPDYLDGDTAHRQDLMAWLTLAQERHPALMAARAQLDSAREKVTATRSEGLPVLDFNQSRYVNGRPNQGLSSTQTTESVSGFTLSVPLFEGFARTYKVRGAQAQVEAREAELRDAETQVLSEVAKSHADASAALHNLDASGHLITAAQAALDNVRRKYDRGISDILEMLNVQAALADAQQERVRSLAEWRSARLRLLASAGMAGLRDIRKQ